MNDIVKTNIKEKLEKALKAEGLTTNEAAGMIGIAPAYLSMIKNPANWPKCSNSAWEAVLNWINSGQRIEEFAEKHGKVVPEKIVFPVSNQIPKDKQAKKSPVQEIAAMMPHRKMDIEQAAKTLHMPELTPVIRHINTGILTQKVVIDLEVNLVINGKRIELK